MNTTMIKTYSELISFDSFQERLNYLYIGGNIGEETFGFERYLNQTFYRSSEWRRVRRDIIVRDLGMDLGVEGYEIHGLIIIHHINPISILDVKNRSSILLDPENLITVSELTHKAIHYNKDLYKTNTWVERKPNDTCPWKKGL